MSFIKKSLFLFGVGFLGLAQVNASQAVAAVLLNEDGSLRCKIVQEEYADGASDELDALRECDSGDELYAEVVLNSQDVQISGIPSPRYLIAILTALGSCQSGFTFSKMNMNYYSSLMLVAPTVASLMSIIEEMTIMPIMKKGFKTLIARPKKFIVIPMNVLRIHFLVSAGAYTLCHYLVER